MILTKLGEFMFSFKKSGLIKGIVLPIGLFALLSVYGNADTGESSDKEVGECPKANMTYYSCQSVKKSKRDFFCSKKKKLSPKRISKLCKRKAKKAKKVASTK
jgi:hypothetical protein